MVVIVDVLVVDVVAVVVVGDDEALIASPMIAQFTDAAYVSPTDAPDCKVETILYSAYELPFVSELWSIIVLNPDPAVAVVPATFVESPIRRSFALLVVIRHEGVVEVP